MRRPLMQGLCRLALAFAVLGAVAGTAAAAAQEPAVAAAAGAGLKARVEARFQVVTLRRGIVLVPKEAQPSFANIEISDEGAVLVDGAPVTGRELRTRVGAAADLVAQLSFLDGDSRRALFAPAPAPPAVPEPPQPDTPAPGQEREPVRETPQATDEGWVERERTERGGARVRVGGDVWVKEDEAVGDAVVAVLGTAIVDGRVDGDVVAVGGDVRLGPKADVRGNAVAVGGSIERQAGARVAGDLSEVKVGFPSPGPWIRFRPWQNWHWFGGEFGASADLFASLLRMAMAGLFAAMLVVIAAAPVRRVSHAVTSDPWRAGLAGLAAQIFFVPVLVVTVVVLTVSIVGIPLLALLPFAMLGVVVALLLGFAGAGCAVGRLVTRRLGSSRLTLLATLVVGLAVIWALTAIARFGGLAGQPLRAILGVVLLAGFVIEYAAWTVGLGGVLLTRFGRRGDVAPVEPPPVPEIDDPDLRVGSY